MASTRTWLTSRLRHVTHGGRHAKTETPAEMVMGAAKANRCVSDRPPIRTCTVVLLVPVFLVTSCATSVPKADDYYRDIPQTDTRLELDMDLLTSSELSQDKKQAGERLVHFFHTAETSLRDYTDALEKSLDINEALKSKYGTVDAVVGGVAGLSSISVIFATAAVAVPIAGAVWIGVGLSIQQFDIQPQLTQGRKTLDEAHDLARLFPDVRVAFRAVVFADSNNQADRRFKVWQVHMEDLKKKVSHFFSKPLD